MTEVLNVINQQLTEELGLNYEFGQMTKSPPTYPYWVGDCSESAPITEDGLEEPTIILTGCARNSYMEMELEKKALKDRFKYGVSVMTESGAAVVIFYDGALTVPSDEADLKKCQVNLKIKSWKGN